MNINSVHIPVEQVEKHGAECLKQKRYTNTENEKCVQYKITKSRQF